LSYSFGQSGPTTPFVMSGGVYPGAPSFTVWGEAGTYYAKNQYGAISFASTNISLLTEQIRVAIPYGGIVKYLKGTYALSHSYYVGDNTVIEGEGTSTIFTLANTVNAPVFISHDWVSTNYGLEIKNIQINGNSAGQGLGTYVGINLVNCWNAKITNTYIINCRSHAISILDSRFVKISGNTIVGNNGDGVQLWNKGDYGVGLYSCEVSNNFIENNSDTGIVSIRAAANKILGNTVISSGENGILLDCATQNIVDGNFVIASSRVTATRSGIVLQNVTYAEATKNNIITNNRCYDWGTPKTQYWGIFEWDNATSNIISNNDCQDNLVNGIFIVGSTTKVSDCWNGTEWIGTSNIRSAAGTQYSIASSPVSIAHNIGRIPSTVLVSSRNLNVTCYVTNRNSSGFDVTWYGDVSGYGGVATIDWYAEYRP
jgi:parallel beta-helix repeat protein